MQSFDALTNLTEFTAAALYPPGVCGDPWLPYDPIEDPWTIDPVEPPAS
jgi:hypothetical protein